jgi:hypothetical protein
MVRADAWLDVLQGGCCSWLLAQHTDRAYIQLAKHALALLLDQNIAIQLLAPVLVPHGAWMAHSSSSC